MTQNIVPLRFDVEQVGKHVKGSKKRFTWDISLNHKSHTIVLDFSFISGKVKVTVDRRVLLENELPTNTSFQYPFTLDGNSMNVIQQGDNFELRVNNKVFSHLYNQMKTNKQFKSYNDEVKDIKVNQNQFQGKKLTLNIGGVGGGMKKKPKNQGFQSHNWEAFGKDDTGSFPNYFGEQKQQQAVQTKFTTTNKAESSVPSNQKPKGNLLDDDQTTQEGTSNTVNNQSGDMMDFSNESQEIVQNSNQVGDFNTMQNMFATMNTNERKPAVKEEVNFFADKQSPFQQPQQYSQSINQQQFNTQMPNSQPNALLFSTQQGLNKNSLPLQKPQQQPVSSGINNSNNNNFNMSDFNTMQQMFATNSLNSMSKPSQVNKPHTSALDSFDWGESKAQHPQQLQQQTFATTNNYGGNSASNQVPDINDFSTMQNLFATGMATVMVPPNSNSKSKASEVPSNIAANNININNNNSKTDANEFSTMQNLFQTGNVSMTANQQLQQQKTSIITGDNSFVGQNNNTNSFSPSSMHMNTYSGNNSGSAFSFQMDNSTNVNNFSTSANVSMKKPQPAQQQPKQKQPQSNDLI